jgi:hypothetical protein
MQFPRRAAPGSTYESQAARWKQGFKPVAAGGPPRQTDLEGALVSELCSSIGSSSFPPREVLHKLLRYLHTLDHEVSRCLWKRRRVSTNGLSPLEAVRVRAAGRQVPEPAVAGASALCNPPSTIDVGLTQTLAIDVQVQAKAVSVLDAILKSSEADFYKRYYFERLDTIEALCRARKDMLRARADKVT